VKYWKASAALDPDFAVVQRNLATAWTHRTDGAARAIALLEKAVSLDRKYPLHFTQLDELYETAAVAPEKRLALLEQNHAVVTRRDDSLAREITLKVVMGKYDDAIGLMTGRRFAVWEGANLNVADDWTSAHLLRGQQRLSAGRAREALADFQRATQIPDNLPAGGRGGGDRSAEAAYFTGTAYQALGDAEHAREAWTRAATPANTGGRGGRGPRAAAMSAAPSYYRALALQKLGRDDEARSILQELAKSSAENGARPAAAHYAAGLGHLGLGEKDQARQEFDEALKLNPAHVGARSALAAFAR
jgi:tetratricopeptide (TPR) repeat protein